MEESPLASGPLLLPREGPQRPAIASMIEGAVVMDGTKWNA